MKKLNIIHNIKYQVGIISNDRLSETIQKELNLNKGSMNIINYSNMEEFWYKNKIKFLDVLILQVGVCLDCIEMISLIKSKNQNIKIIILTQSQDPEKMYSCFKAGVMGYILMDDIQNIGNYIKKVIKNEPVITPSETEGLIRYIINLSKKKSEDNGNSHLSNKETQILRLLSQGQTLREIASTYQTSIYTVRTQVYNIMKKLKVNNRTQLMIKASDMGFL
ncbi:MAG: response regulator transcription factor [Leptospiraceae bacterium]|nr:response regulator transcription factor [Leptospiraceae bacterium]